MNFTCSKDNLLKILSHAFNAVEPKPVENTLKCFHLDVSADWLTVQANNYQLGIKVGMEIFTRETGSLLVDAKKFIQIIKACRDEINFSLDKSSNILNVESGRTKFSVPTSNAADFPQVKINSSDKVFNISSQQFIKLIKDTSFACSNSPDSAPVYTGCLFHFKDNSLNVVATDKHRLAVSKFPLLFDDLNGINAIVPADSLKAVSNILKDFDEHININIGDNFISFSVNNLSVTSRIIDGDFPPYERIFQSDFCVQLTVNAADFVSILNRVFLINDDDKIYQKIRLNLSADSLKVFAQSISYGEAEESFDARFSGSDLRVAFNAKFLIEGLKVFGNNDCTLKFGKALNGDNSFCPVEIYYPDGNKSFVYVLTPLRA